MVLSIKLSVVLIAVTLIATAFTAPLDSPDEDRQQGNIQNDDPQQASQTSPSSTTKPKDKQFKREDSASTELPDVTSYKNTSTFTCYGRVTGYYADVKLGCRVYHFCTQLEGYEATNYQRMSYICLEDSIFDQRDLNCVREKDLKVACDRAEEEYDSSNKQFDMKEESPPSYSDNLAANIMMNPLTRFIAGR